MEGAFENLCAPMCILKARATQIGSIRTGSRIQVPRFLGWHCYQWHALPAYVLAVFHFCSDRETLVPPRTVSVETPVLALKNRSCLLFHELPLPGVVVVSRVAETCRFPQPHKQAAGAHGPPSPPHKLGA